MNQTSIFDIMYPKYKTTKPIRLIELFGGYGSQALALKYLGVKFEHWKLVEWAVKSIQAYKDIHFSNYIVHYYKEKTKEEMVDLLFKKGISSNYNEPMTKEQVNRLSETQLKNILSNIYITNNLVDIQQVKGKDLEIVDTDKYEYIMTYSFPCQDLSLAGKGKGMSDTGTRSGLLWEVERILTECHELGSMPQILLMENVPQVHSVDNLPDFHKWQVRLEQLGYKSYWQDLIATDFEIPQTRNRCFMISILGDYSYTFPNPKPLKLKLKDMLEDNVNEKYYLSDKMKEYIFSEDSKYKVNKNSLKLNREIACAKTTREGNTRADTSDYIADKVINTYDEYNHKINGNETIGTIQAMYPIQNHGHRLIETCMLKNQGKEISRITENAGTIMARDYKGYGNQEMNAVIQMECEDQDSILIKNANSKGYLKAHDGDGIDISSRMKYHRGTVQKGKTQTLTTKGGENNGVVIRKYGLFDKNNKTHQAGSIYDKNGSSPTLDTGTGGYRQPMIEEATDLRIRKLTPRECFRLMGVKDEDYEKCAKNQSDSSLYHLAGDSIVVNVLMAIFKELL